MTIAETFEALPEPVHDLTPLLNIQRNSNIDPMYAYLDNSHIIELVGLDQTMTDRFFDSPMTDFFRSDLTRLLGKASRTHLQPRHLPSLLSDHSLPLDH